MGYRIGIDDHDLHIDKDHIAGALTELEGADIVAELSEEEILQRLELALDGVGLDFTREDDGLVLSQWTGENSSDEEDTLASIATHIRPGSFIEWSGEDGQSWRYDFTAQGMTESTGHRVFYDKDELRNTVRDALNADSNDAEHEALTEIADLLGLSYDEATDAYK